MSKSLKTKYYNQQYYQGYYVPSDVDLERIQKLKRYKKIKQKKPKSLIAVLFSLILLGLYGYYVCPYNFNNYLGRYI